jgi:hypothetical protein
MMGTKVRSFAPLPHDLSLEELVPKDHFYRRLQATLDLSFVGSVAVLRPPEKPPPYPIRRHRTILTIPAPTMPPHLKA